MCFCNDWWMKQPRKLVQLELQLEAKTVDFTPTECRKLAKKLELSAIKRMELARKLERWAHQLKMKARIIEAYEHRPSASLKEIPQWKAERN